MVVNAGTVVRRPNFKDCHTSRTKSLVRKKLQSDVSSPIIIDFIENLLLCHVFIALAFLFVRLEIFVLLLALHLVQMIHDSNGKSLGSVSIGSDQAVMECKLQALPVEILVFFLIGDRWLNEIWQAADIEILQAIEKVAKRCWNRLEVCQGRLEK